MTKLFVGGLPYETTQQDLENMFVSFGKVVSAIIIKDRETGKGKGFGFVEIENDEDAKRAIEELDGSPVNNRKIIVNVARPREERSKNRFHRSGNYRGNRN